MILASSDLYKDPRVYRQVIALQDTFDLVTVTNLSARHKDFSSRIQHIVIDSQHQTYNSDNIFNSGTAASPRGMRQRIVALKNSRNILLRTLFAVLRTVYRIFMAAKVRFLIRSPERFRKFYFSNKLPLRLKEILQQTPVDVILVNEIDCLPSAVEFGLAGKIIYDAHEFSLGEAEESLTWRLVNKAMIQHICNTYIPKVYKMITVCDGILAEYKRLYPSVSIDLITNASPYYAIRRRRTARPVKIIHHGLADRSRNIEGMIATMGALQDKDRYTLDLMLVFNDTHYVNQLKALAAEVNRNAGFEQIRFVKPVPLKEIVPTISKYDIQIIMTPPVNFNNRFSLPNKFFEAIQARNALAIGPITEMAKIVRQYQLGVVSDSFEARDMASCLNALTTADIEKFRLNAEKTARALNAEANAKELIRIVRETLGNKSLLPVRRSKKK